MKIAAIASWFGGKRTMAPLIARELGKHGQYFEPFCGGMSVLFAKEPAQKETVNDLHGALINLARVVQDDELAPRLYGKLQRVLFCESVLEDARRWLEGRPESCDPLSWAYWYFIACWMGRNGTAGTDREDYQIAVRWTRNGGSPTVRWRNVVESIPEWHRRLQNVVILQRDAFGILPKFEDHESTAIYVDPPYVDETRSRLGSGRGGMYLHEFNHESSLMGPDDHTRLAGILREFKRARIVVSYYDCPQVRELYDGWTFVNHGRVKHMAAMNARVMNKADAPEILVINGPSYVEGTP